MNVRSGQAVRDASVAYIQSSNLHYQAHMPSYQTSPDLPVGAERSIIAAGYAALCSLTSREAIGKLADEWKNSRGVCQKLGAIGKWLKNALVSAGLGFAYGYLMTQLEKLIQPLLNSNTDVLQRIQGAQVPTASCTAAALVTFVVRCLFHVCRGNQGSSADAPWRLENMMEIFLVAAASGICNYACVHLAISGFVPVLLSFVVVSLVDYLIKKVKSEAQHLGLWRALLRTFTGWFRVRHLAWSNVPDDIPKGMCCPISKRPFVEPVAFYDMVFEKWDLEKYIVEHGTHPKVTPPMQVSSLSIRPCPEMKILVEEYARQHNMNMIELPPLDD